MSEYGQGREVIVDVHGGANIGNEGGLCRLQEDNQKTF
jgi:hypothetical protein